MLKLTEIQKKWLKLYLLYKESGKTRQELCDEYGASVATLASYANDFRHMGILSTYGELAVDIDLSKVELQFKNSDKVKERVEKQKGRKLNEVKEDSEWIELYGAWVVSGLTQSEFCDKHNIPARTFAVRTSSLRKQILAEWIDDYIAYKFSDLSLTKYCEINNINVDSFNTALNHIALLGVSANVSDDDIAFKTDLEWYNTYKDMLNSGLDILQYCKKSKIDIGVFIHALYKLNKQGMLSRLIAGQTEKYWINLTTSYIDSNMTLDDFCNQHKLNKSIVDVGFKQVELRNLL